MKTKADSASPTVYTNYIFLTSIVDTHKGRAIVVIDVFNTYLNAEIDEFLF